MSKPSESHRLLLFGPEDGVGRRDREVLDALGVTDTLQAPERIPGSLPDGGGWIVVPAGASREAVAALVVGLSRSVDPWSLLLLTHEGDETRVLPISPGYVQEPDEVAARVRGDGMEAGYLGHRRVLTDLGRIRHDVNNALTAALAETQFMRMDAEDGSEQREGLQIVEDQLQKIRALVAELTALRVISR